MQYFSQSMQMAPRPDMRFVDIGFIDGGSSWDGNA
jgi:hypothetical protein